MDAVYMSWQLAFKSRNLLAFLCRFKQCVCSTFTVFTLKDSTIVILSHRWGHEEASSKEMRKSTGWEGKNGSGWDKIRSTCCIAAKESFTWVWIDICCIYKDSSAELTEAINSMFNCMNHLASAMSTFRVFIGMSTMRPVRFRSKDWDKVAVSRVAGRYRSFRLLEDIRFYDMK